MKILKKKYTQKGICISCLFVFLVLSSWEFFSRHGIISSFFFPSPCKILQTIYSFFMDGTLSIHLLATLQRLLFGFLIGCNVGFILGILMGYSSFFRNMIDPFIAAIHPIPKIALLPLIMAILGIGEASKIFSIALASFFPMVINTMSGVMQIPKDYYEIARSYGAGNYHIFLRVILPASMPSTLSGVRLALNMSLVNTIAIEIISAKNGLGTLIWFAWETLHLAELYATLVVISLLGSSFNFLMQRLYSILVPWREMNKSDN